MKNLSEKALLANLTICQWSAKKMDKKVSRQIEKEHNAKNAGYFNKILIADKELKEIQKVAGATRTFLYHQTLPWGDNGDRLLPSTNYFEFVSEFRKLKEDFTKAVKKFIVEYPALKEDAQSRLNGMFQESDYPPLHVIQSKFRMEISFMPISNTKDFRLEVDAEEVENLRNQIEYEINSRIAETTKNIWTRIKEAIGHMVERLTNEDAIFQNSLVENIHELIEVLPRLNFTQDTDVTEIINEMRNLIINPENLRTNMRLRRETAKEAKAIYDKVTRFLG